MINATVTTFVLGILLNSNLSFSNEKIRPAIGYGSSTYIVNDKIQEGFISGFHLGFETKSNGRSKNNRLLINQMRDQSPLGAIVSAKNLLNSGVSALFGFPGSTDALLVAKFARESGVLAIFPGCNHNGLAKNGASIFSTGHSGTHEVLTQIKIAGGKLKFKRGLVIINPMAAPSASLEEIYLSEEAKRRSFGIELEIARLQRDLTLDPTVIKLIESRRYDFLIFTPYPEASVKFVDQLIAANADIPVIAGSAWGTVDSDVMRRFVSGKKANFFMQTSWLPDSSSATPFRMAFKKRYAKEPTTEAAYGYDLGIIASTLLDRIPGTATREKAISSFHSNLCFKNLSVGKICFPKNGGHAKRTIYFLKFTSYGFKLAYEVNLD